MSKTAEIKEKFIPKCKKENSDIQSQNTFGELGKAYKSLRQSWHQELDDIFDKIDFLSKTFKDQNLNRLPAYKSDIRNSKCDLRY